MLLWIGAILCFIAYSIQASTVEEPADDNVSVRGRFLVQSLSILSSVIGYHQSFCAAAPAVP